MTSQLPSSPAPGDARARTFRDVLAVVDPFADEHPALLHALESVGLGARVTLIACARPLPGAVCTWPFVPAELAAQPFVECRARLLELADQLLPEHVHVEVEVHVGPLRHALRAARARGDYDLLTVDRPRARRQSWRMFRRRVSAAGPTALLMESVQR